MRSNLGDLLGHLIAALAIWVLREELKSGLERLSRRLVQAAATGLVGSRRSERLRDWLAELDHLGPLSRMGFAIGLWISYRKAPAVQSAFNTFRFSLQLAIKRSFDLTFAIIGLIGFSPILLAIAIAVAVDSPGGVLYKAKRVGQAGRPIEILRFRTTFLDDQRLTKIGRQLRRLSLDELPQLLNIVRGELSLVGPRPDLWLPGSITRLERNSWTNYQHIRPGLTGPWQAQFMDAPDWEDKVELELHYARHWSLAIDFAVLIATVRAALTFRLAGQVG